MVASSAQASPPSSGTHARSGTEGARGGTLGRTEGCTAVLEAGAHRGALPESRLPADSYCALADASLHCSTLCAVRPFGERPSIRAELAAPLLTAMASAACAAERQTIGLLEAAAAALNATLAARVAEVARLRQWSGMSAGPTLGVLAVRHGCIARQPASRSHAAVAA